MIETELILKNKIMSKFGWTRTNHPKPGRTIKIGNQRNCNDDACFCNPYIERNLKDILEKYEISKYSLRNINTKYEYSFELYLDEDVYQNLAKKLNVI